MKPIRLACLLLALLASTPGLGAAGLQQDPAVPPAAAEPEAQSLGAKLSKVADDAAGWVVGKLSSVFFYPLFQASDAVTAEGAVTDGDAVAALLAQLAAQDKVDPAKCDLVLTLPASASLEPAQLEELGEALKARFLATPRAFSVVLAEDPAQAGSVLTATRGGVPIVVLWLILGATFFTLRMGFINLRAFKHAIHVTRGCYDNPEDEGEVSHFQALASALSATVGLGNIAGVAIAVSIGGPGAVMWLILAGLLGMSSKFTECTLGQKYREVRPDGRVMGGAMFYLSKGLSELKLPGLGKVLAVLFALFCIGGSFGGGNTFQVNQSLNALGESVPFLAENRWVYGLIMTFLVGIVILGGIKRIAATAEKIVPLMCTVYVLACLWVILEHAGQIPNAFATIFNQAFTPEAGFGGFIGVLVQGFRRAAFSNEAGVGSAAIAHSAARTPYPVREGVVALLEPFIDTVVVCTMTGLVIVVTGAYANPEYSDLIVNDEGATLTSRAFGEILPWFPYVLSVAVVLFAYSTMISWSYYGERCWAWLFGDRTSLIYRLMFLAMVFLGSIITSSNVLDFGDLMILSMAFPNIAGLLLLSSKVRRDLDDYMARLRAGEFKRYK